MNIEGVDRVLKLILDDEDDIDVKEIGHPDPESEGWWEQVGGDFGDPWLYGGTWWNVVKRRLVHFDGVEQKDEIRPEDIQLPDQAMAKLKAKVFAEVHDPWMDTDEAKEDPEWHAKHLRDEQRDMEWKIDQAVGNYQYARAAFLNDRKRYTFYDTDVPEESLPHWLERYVEPVKRSLGVEAEFDLWPVHMKVAEIYDQNGSWGEAGGFDMNKLEAQKFFGFRL